MKIVKLTAANVKRLTAVEITPDGNLVIIGGENGAGKSSVLDSIMYALAGAKSIPSQPVRTGAKAAKIRVELDGEKHLIVERTMGPTGGSLVVKAAGGVPFAKPQGILDSLCGTIAFDPLEFTRLKPRDQAERLRELVGLDFTEHDVAYAEAFNERTILNREAKALKARLDAMPEDPGAPDREVSVSLLVDELQRRQDVNAGNVTARRSFADLKDQAAQLQLNVEGRKSRIAAMERQLEAEREALRLDEEEAQASAQQLADRQKEVDALQDEDTAEVERQIADSDQVNARVRARRAREEAITQFKTLYAQCSELTETLKGFDIAKKKALESAKWPVEGLGFDDEGVTYNGLPFDQASSADMLKVSVAIGAALKPKLRVMLIRDGSLLDAKSLATIAKMAEELDLQPWIERVGDGEECTVVIEDGHVREEVTAQ